jgi:hypothetical protein
MSTKRVTLPDGTEGLQWDMSSTHEDTITIPRAQYDALMAVAKALANIVPRFEKACLVLGSAEWATKEATKMHHDALAALRAAGIHK